MIPQVWLKRSGLTLARRNLFISIKYVLRFQGSILLDSVSKKLPRVIFYNRKIKYVKTRIHELEKLTGDYIH